MHNLWKALFSGKFIKLKYEQEQIAYGNPDAPRAGGKDQLVDEGGMSGHPDGQRVLVGGHEHGFIAAVTAAFRDHYPLSLKPQHFWLMIAQAVAVHVSTILLTCPLVVMGHYTLRNQLLL